MSQDLELECRCGKVHGWVREQTPRKVVRAVCYCDDCQAFAHYLGRADLLDAHGGSEITMVATSKVEFDRGAEQIEAIRFSPRGPLRCYARCCRTPLGNTGTRFPFAVGFVHEAFRAARELAQRDALLGPVQGRVFGKYALGGPPPGAKSFDIRLMARALPRMLAWRLRGRGKPSPYFERDLHTPKFPVKLVAREERQALRAKCGPQPTA